MSFPLALTPSGFQLRNPKISTVAKPAFFTDWLSDLKRYACRTQTAGWLCVEYDANSSMTRFSKKICLRRERATLCCAFAEWCWIYSLFFSIDRFASLFLKGVSRKKGQDCIHTSWNAVLPFDYLYNAPTFAMCRVIFFPRIYSQFNSENAL